MTLLLDCLSESHTFSRTFNGAHELRTALWKAGFMKQLPNLLRQETSSLAVATKLLYRLYRDPKRTDAHDMAEQRILASSAAALEFFCTLSSDKQREIWTPVIVLLLRCSLSLPEDRFKTHVRVYYRSIADMFAFDLLPELRAVLREFFLLLGERFGTLKDDADGADGAER